MKRILRLSLVVLAAIATSAQWIAPLPLPAYHPAPPPKTAALPAILSGPRLTGKNFQHPYQVQAYKLAARISGLLYQLPCYCHCDRSVGHTSLRSCYESEHGAHCGTCMQEAFYAYQIHQKGKTAKEIRDGIIRSEFQSVDLRTASSIN